MELTGINPDGRISAKNGLPFSLPESISDIRDVLSLGDVIGFEETGREWTVTFVDLDTVRMKLNG